MSSTNEGRRESESPSASTDGNRSTVVARLRRQARALRLQSWVAILLVVASLGAGVSIFVLAGALTKQEDLQYTERLLTQMLAATQRQAEVNRSWAEGVATAGQILARVQVSARPQDSAIPSLPPPPDVFGRLLPDENSTPRMAATVATRIGAVLILIFLVQILVTMHRYTVRLAAFYDARADAIQLLGSVDGGALSVITQAMASEAIQFDVLPPSPASSAVDLAKEIVSRK